MDNFISIIIFFIIFGMLVISHESGHFLIARANNIRVKEFTVGLGPVLLQRIKKGTAYSIRLLPFGGACIYDGIIGFEDEDDEVKAPFFAPRAGIDTSTVTPAGMPFPEANVFARIATVVGGPLFNVILAYLLSLVVTYFTAWSFPVVADLT
ncbi:MAG: site-2 protease family protein, partial [Lachnospiraceae bacterium]|nr:site-2 protease family protein [Lachnospiraceae bacterium]